MQVLLPYAAMAPFQSGPHCVHLSDRSGATALMGHMMHSAACPLGTYVPLRQGRHSPAAREKVGESE